MVKRTVDLGVAPALESRQVIDLTEDAMTAQVRKMAMRKVEDRRIVNELKAMMANRIWVEDIVAHLARRVHESPLTTWESA